MLNLKVLLVTIAIGITGVLSAAVPPLKAKNTDMYYVNPNVKTTLSWRITKSPPGRINYLIRDYHGIKVTSGTVNSREHSLLVSINLPRGYYEIIFPELNYQAGLVVLEKYVASVDEFYGADAAWSWLEAKAANRAAWMRLLKRYGIGIARERFTWGELEENKHGKFAAVRREYAEHGLKILEVHHDSPKRFNNGKGGMMSIPAELGEVFKSWQGITRRFASVWTAAETWNEENDEIFCGDTPPDLYTAYHKTLANAISRTSKHVKVLNGGFTEDVIPEYLDAMGKNGLLDFVDAVAFHVYKAPEALQHSIKRYRDWMTQYGHPGLPIWVTEAGSGYPKTSGLRAAEKDSINRAARFNALGVEAKACDVERFFPFVFAWYNLETTNYSLVDSLRTPTRALAGYFFQIHQLAGSNYAGTLNLKNDSVVTARVFRRNKQATVVIFTGQPAVIDFPAINILQAFGVDGRKLLPPENGRLNIPDGLIYLTAPWDILAPRTSPATALLPRPTPRSQPFSPLVLQYLPAPEITASMRQGYKVEAKADGTLQLTFRIWNFAKSHASAFVKMPNAIPEKQPVMIPPQSSVTATVKLRLPKLSSVTPSAFSAQIIDKHGHELDRICLYFTARERIKSLLKSFPNYIAVPLETKRIKNQIATGGINKLSFSDNSVTANIDLRPCSGAWNNWAGIYIKLSELDFSGKTGIVFRESCTGAGWSDITWELRNNDRFRTIGFPMDSAEHDIYIPFMNKRMVYFASYDSTKANKHFDPADITAVEFVVHSRNRVNTLTISKLYLVGPKP